MSFFAGLEAYGGHTALILESGRQVSYQELAALADDLFSDAAAPQRRGALLAIECRNELPSVAAYLGALRHQQPALLIDAGLDGELRDRLYAHFKVAHVLSAEGLWRATGHDSPMVHPDVGLLLSTSGSTGSAKLVKLSRQAINANAQSIASYLGLNDNERPITTLPMHYSYGLSVLNSHFAVGATVLLTAQPVTTRAFWSFLLEHEASSMAGVPTTYAMLKQLKLEQRDVPSLKTLTQAGGRLAPPMVQWFGELATIKGWRFFVMYGQTEATARIAYMPPERILDKPDSIGQSIPGGSLTLLDAQGELISESGVTGELQYQGENVMMGYAQTAEDLALPDSQHGMLRTGDLAVRDAEGFYYVVGRMQRFIKLFGNRYGLDEVEAELRNAGYEVAVTGRDDFLLVAAKGEAPVEDDIRAHLMQRYRLQQSVIRVVMVDAFPMSAAGKVLYAQLLEVLTRDDSSR